MKIWLKTLGMLIGGFILLVALTFGCMWLEGLDDEADYNNGICIYCGDDYEFSNVSKSRSGINHYYYHCVGCGNIVDAVSPMETEKQEIAMTVDEFVSLPGDYYFIVKAKGDFGVLESDIYMDREIVEVAVCDDTPNTICLFIQLENEEQPHYRKVD